MAKPSRKTIEKVNEKHGKVPKRNEVYIRVSDIPDQMFKDIEANAKTEGRSMGKEVLNFLIKQKY